MTHISVLTLVLLGTATLCSSTGLSTAHAAQKRSPRKTPEVYSAIDLDSALDITLEAAPAEDDAEIARTSFYQVPPKNKLQIAARLNIVHAILMESGRAYDYRSYTTRQLQDILKELRAR